MSAFRTARAGLEDRAKRGKLSLCACHCHPPSLVTSNEARSSAKRCAGWGFFVMVRSARTLAWCCVAPRPHFRARLHLPNDR